MYDELSIYLNLHLKTERNLSQNTIDAYRSDLNQFFEFAGNGNLNAINYDIAFAFKKMLIGKSLLPVTVNRKLAAVRSFFDFLYVNKYLKKQNTAVFIESMNPGLRLPYYLREDETKILIESVNRKNNLYYGGPFRMDLWDTLWIRDRAMLETLYAAGCRISEAITVEKSNVNLNEKIIKVRGKGSKDRIIPIGKHAVKWLKRYLEDTRPVMIRKDKSAAKNHLFLNRNGRPMTRMAAFNIVRLAGEIAGMNGKRIYPHIIRHSIATHLLDRQFPIELLMSFLGHESINSTMLYTHVSVDRLKKTIAEYHPREIWFRKEEKIRRKREYMHRYRANRKKSMKGQ